MGDTRGRLARAHARVGRIRADAMHKLTTHLTRTHGTIVVEKLSVAGMMRNRRLARALADASMAELRRQLIYKCGWYGSRVVEADTFLPQFEDLFPLWGGQSHAAPVGADLPVRSVWIGARPGSERGEDSRGPGGRRAREWPGTR